MPLNMGDFKGCCSRELTDKISPCPKIKADAERQREERMAEELFR